LIQQVEKELGKPLSLFSADPKKKRAPAATRARARKLSGLDHPIWFGNAAILIAAAVSAVGVVVARSPVGIADLASVVKSPADCKVTESLAAKSSFAVTASAETTTMETASQSTTVEATSAKAPAVAACKPAAPTSQRFMVSEHQGAGKQQNDGNRRFLPHDIPLMLQRRIALDSSAVHLRPAIFPISAVRHGRLLLGWCDAGSDAPITEETRLEGALFPHVINGLVTLPCSAASAARLNAIPALVGSAPPD
jgi:hypothetical protein